MKSDRLDVTACLIADVQMPGVNGLELHRRLVSSGRPIPTILVTAYSDDRLRARAAKAGVAGCLSKPFADRDLLACIHSALAKGTGDSLELKNADAALTPAAVLPAGRFGWP